MIITVLTQLISGIVAEPDEMQAMHNWVVAQTELHGPLPFSFVYDGVPSSDFLPKWERSPEASLALNDHRTKLTVRCEIKQFDDFPAVEWVVYLTNHGETDSPIIEDVRALDAVFAANGDPVLHYAKGAVCSMDDYAPMTRVLNPGGKTHLQPGGGRSSSEFLPFFNLELGGKGVVIATGWSGEWAADFERGQEPDKGLQSLVHLDEDKVRARSGMALTHLKLHPGETIRTPRMLLLFYKGDIQRGQNLLRQFILKYHSPKDIQPVPVFNGNWGGTSAADHLENIRAIAARDLPMEYYWIDAEWFGTGKWHQTAGDWRIKKDLYPDGFKPISDALHQSGRKLLVWFEPERVCEGTPWYSELKDWLLEVPKEKRAYNWGMSQAEPDWVNWESKRNQIKENDRLFNLGIPDARAFLADYMSKKIDEMGLDCYRHDANIAPLEFWRAADAPDRQGIAEIRWVQGLYAFWDELLARHPNLIIDNCASGGRRIDLESISRTTPLWNSDFSGDAIGRQCHLYGLSFWVPLQSTGCPNVGSESAYSVRSTFSSSFVFGLFGNGDASQSRPAAPDFPYDEAKKMLAQYRSIQPYFLGDYYPLTQYSKATDAWLAWQYHRPDLDAGVVQVFRRPDSICETGRLQLHGLDRDKKYKITNMDTSEVIEMTGAEIANKGFPVTLLERPAAALFIYSPLSR